MDAAIDAALAARLIGAQFPQWAGLAVRPVAESGWDNRSFRLGERLLIRMPSAACYQAQVEKEQAWLPKLAPQLSLAIPRPVAKGAPGCGYPWPWSVYGWIPGERASSAGLPNLDGFAADLAAFLHELHRADAAGAPGPGRHCFFRGGDLGVYDGETRQAIGALAGSLDTGLALDCWQTALSSAWQEKPLWVHGDLAPGNLLTRQGRLHAVLDFGACCVGDPACDLVIAWTFLQGASRAIFRQAVGMDAATWQRARGWALWKALITLAGAAPTNAPEALTARRTVAALLQEHRLLG